MNSALYRTSNDDQLSAGPRRSSKALPKAKHAPKKGHGHCSVVCSWSDPLQLSKSWQNHCIWEVCSTNWSDALKIAMLAAGTGQQKVPNSSPWQRLTVSCTAHASKVEQIELQSFASTTIFTWALTNWLSHLQASRQLFAGKILPQLTRCRKCFPRVQWILKHGLLCCRNKQIYFSLAKNVLIVMILILINKDVFESSRAAVNGAAKSQTRPGNWTTIMI